MKKKWIFADWGLPNDADFALIKEMKFTDVVLGLGLIKDNRFYCKYSAADIVAAATRLKKAGLSVHLMTWIKRNATFINDMCQWIAKTCDAFSPASVLLDAELDWHKGNALSPEAGAARVHDSLLPLPCKLGVTGLSNLHKTVRPLLDICDYGLGQAYSIWKPGDPNHWSHGNGTEPGTQQIESWASWSAAGKPLIMGLSNYWAARPARKNHAPLTAADSLQKALDASIHVGATEVAFWSLKWLRKNTAAGQVARQFTAGIPVDQHAQTTDNSPSAIQWLLVEMGYDLGKTGPNHDGVDGSWGQLSQQALNQFRQSQGLSDVPGFVLQDVTALVTVYRQRL